MKLRFGCRLNEWKIVEEGIRSKRGSLLLLVDIYEWDSDKWKGWVWKMKEIYRKTSIFSFIGGIGATIFGIIFYFFGYEDFSTNGDTLFEAGLFALIFIGAGFYFKNAHGKLSNETSSAGKSC